jgi:hypothetical protein
VPVIVFLFEPRDVGNHQKSGSFEQHHFVCRADVGEIVKLRLQHLDIWNERIDYLGPCPVQGLIPNTRGKETHLEVLRMGSDLSLTLSEGSSEFSGMRMRMG